MYSSKQAGRSFNTVSTILLGQSGHGKSSTVNHLLGVKIAKTSNRESETRSTTEFKLVGPEPGLGVTDLNLCLVDTPGFGDTDGLAQDACNLASIAKFLEESGSGRQHCYPNIILIVFHVGEKRFSGKSSTLYKTLLEVGKLGIVDKKRPNVVLVLTHICSEPDEEEVADIASELIRIIKETLGVPAEAVCLENSYNKFKLEVAGDQTRLPNGTLQPKNLYLAISSRLRENEDNLALMAYKKFFGEWVPR
jgi:GTPase SAR1 family protein